MSISTNESEEDQQYPFPSLTAYVTIKLDPVKSVEVLEDQEATALAREVVSKVYVGYIANVRATFGIVLNLSNLTQGNQEGDWDDDDDEDNDSYFVQLLRTGLPKASPDEDIERDMCIPVFPNTNHPTRKPVKPSEPLPSGWENCYHASFEAVTLRVPVTYANDDLAITMPTDERFLLNSAIMDDQIRRTELSKTVHTNNLLSMAPFAHAIPGSSSNEDKNDTVAAASTSRQSMSSRARTLSTTSSSDDIEHKPVPPPISIMSYDLSTVPTLADPQDLLAEIKHIEK